MTFRPFSFILRDMQLIDGRALAARIREQLKTDLAVSGLRPKLAVLLVGDDAPSHLYVNLKEKAAREVGIETDIRRLPADATVGTIGVILDEWNRDETVDAILVQLPLPSHLDENAVVGMIDPRKDADGFHPKNVEALLVGTGTIIPPLHEGILRLIGATDAAPNGARAAIVANSDVFSKPLAYLLSRAGASVTVTKPDTPDIDAIKGADIVVIAVGRAGFLTVGMIKPGACIIDVGTNRVADGKVVGDVDANGLSDVPGWLSPVPGGVGPMTIAMLLKNVAHLATSRRGA